MNILITGANGFIGRNIKKNYLKFGLWREDLFNAHFLDSRDMDLTDSEKVKTLFDACHFDVIINCAGVGGSRVTKDNESVFYKNVRIFDNLVRNKKDSTKFIYFGSGAEFDRDNSIDDYPEFYFDNNCCKVPKCDDFYGYSKYIQNQYQKTRPNLINLRVFAAFGADELPVKFFRYNIDRILKGSHLTVHQDRFFTFFHVDDLYQVIKHIIESDEWFNSQSINMAYEDTYRLSALAKMLQESSKTNLEIYIENKKLGNSYSGNGKKLFEYNCKYIQTIDRRINQVWKELSNGR